MTTFEDRFRDLGAQLHGGAPIRTATLPAPSIPQPVMPTTSMVVDGVELAPTERLAALASIRDKHRAAVRFATDRAAELRLRIIDEEQRCQMIESRLHLGVQDERAEGELAVIRSQIEQLRAGRATAQAEADEAATSLAAAQRVLRAAVRFAVNSGAIVSITLEDEIQKDWIGLVSGGGK